VSVLADLFSRLSEWFAGLVDQIPAPVLLAIVFLGGLIEATPFLGILVPAHTAVFAIAYQYGLLGRPAWPLVLACALGGALGDLVFYVLGRRWGITFMERFPAFLRLGPERRARLEALFDAHGMKTIVIARTQPVTRSFAPYVAGAARLSALRFLPAAGLGSLIVAVLVVAAGYVTGLGQAWLGQVLEGSLTVAVVAIAVLLVLYLVVTRKYGLMRLSTLNLAVAGAASAVVAGVLVRDAMAGGRLHASERASWLAAWSGLPDGLVAAAGWAHAVVNVHTLALAFCVLFVLLARKRKWRAAYATLAAGPGLLGVILLLRWRLPRLPPSGAQPPFPMTGSFPDDVAALGLALAVVAAWWSIDLWKGPTARAGRALVVSGGAALAAIPLLDGSAWPTSTVAGLALGGAWSCLCLVGCIAARHLTDPLGPTTPRAASWLRARWDAACGWADRRLWGRSWPLLAIIALGVLLRLLVPWWRAVGPDADRYSAMAHGLLETGGFTMAWGDIYSPGTGPAPSHHFPPLYPTILAGFFHLLGFDRGTLRVASIAMALLALLVTYLCTRDLYGHRRGLVATAVVAAAPVFLLTTAKAYSENLILVLFVLAMWAILKSLDRPWFIVLAALFAGLGYLAKSSMGYFFIVAGLGGLAWRLRWRGAKVLRDPPYLAAIALFGCMVLAWAVRNHLHFGDWQTSAHLGAAYAAALAHPGTWATLLVLSTLLIGGLGYLVFMAAVAWLPSLQRIPLMESEHDSGLWLAFLLPLPLTVAIDAALWLYERDFYFHNVRYVSFALVPLAWLLMRHVRPSRATWAALAVTFGVLLAGSLWYAQPDAKLENQVSSAWGPLVADGDSVTFVATNDVYRYYFDLTADGTRTLDVRYAPRMPDRLETDWVLVRGNHTGLPPGYDLAIGMHTGSGELLDQITVWRRAQQG
jgi:membrane protein DedA with SNARE-associated domain/4-amino-4-deoxy-L-arabinose transferase-like glycosyltransferase